ncbi:MAG: NotI family restriction endonuclease [Pseudomonadota bacterium]
MAAEIIEFFGYPPLHPNGVDLSDRHHCPFVEERCTKVRGACVIKQVTADPVIICPKRLYAQQFQILKDIAEEAFGVGTDLIDRREGQARVSTGKYSGNEVVVFGYGHGGELGIPAPSSPGSTRSGTFKIDFVLSRLNKDGSPQEFAAVEVQTIDTTGTYAPAAESYLKGLSYLNDKGGVTTSAGLNWENVSKRILPQIIYKGNVLKREELCKKGLFFVLPHAVYEKIQARIGSQLMEYPISAGSVTFMTYDRAPEDGVHPTPLQKKTQFTTSVDQIAYAFVSPLNLPEKNAYAKAISNAMR